MRFIYIMPIIFFVHIYTAEDNRVSRLSTIIPTVACVNYMQNNFQLYNEGSAETDDLKLFVQLYKILAPQMKHIFDEELKIRVGSEAEVNAFLQKLGINRSIESTDNSAFHVFSAAYFKIQSMWKRPGIKSESLSHNIFYKKQAYETAILKDGFRVYQIPTNEEETKFDYMVEITAKGKRDDLYLCPLNLEMYNKLYESSEVTLVNLVDSFYRRPWVDTTYNYRYLKFPCVQLQEKNALSWLNKLGRSETRKSSIWRMQGAFQQTDVSIDQRGLNVQPRSVDSFESAYGIKIGDNESIFTLDTPFLMFVTRRGIRIPIITALCYRDCWKKIPLTT